MGPTRGFSHFRQSDRRLAATTHFQLGHPPILRTEHLTYEFVEMKQRSYT